MATAQSRLRLCLVTTSPLVVRFFLVPHLAGLSEHFEVTLVANGDCSELLRTAVPCVRMRVLPIRRETAPLQDLAGLARLASFLFSQRFDAVITIAPKAGLLGMIAARLARVRFRCHVFQGEVWATRRGPSRALLKLADRVVGNIASESLVVSHSEREFLIREGIAAPGRLRVLGYGSLGGVDTAKFAPNPANRTRIRRACTIPGDAVVVTYIGRVKVDKGVLDLAAAWREVANRHQKTHLVIIGPDEDNLQRKIRDIVGPALEDRLHIRDLTSEPEAWHAAADIVVLPSYREGLGTVLLEAGAAGVPVVASRIYGIADAVIENRTGLMHPAGDEAALADCLERLVVDPALRAQLGTAGREFVSSKFCQTDVVSRFVKYIVDHAKCRTDS